MKKFELISSIYWKNKANKFENKYKTELAKNDPLKTKLAEVQEKLLNLYESRENENKAIKELKKRLSDLEEIVKNKKKEK